MRRKNAIQIEVVSPTKGLSTRLPSNQPDKSTGRSMTVALNVRFEDGVVMTAPGMEAITICPPDALDGSGQCNFLVQSNITSGVANIQKDSPILGFPQKIYRLDRRFGADCLPSDSEVIPSEQWYVDTSGLTSIGSLVGFEVHAFTSGNPTTAAHTALLGEYVAGVDFDAGDVVNITANILSNSLAPVSGVLRVYLIIQRYIGTEGIHNRDTNVDVETVGFSGTLGQGVMLDALFDDDKTGGFVAFADKSTGFTIDILDGV